jgi:2-polyprenyl-3-methyl-5-hydroxy-6-metoxy-1,4-benzoquinol methylase
VRGLFPQDLPDHSPFDVISMLAVLEHIPPDGQGAIARSCLEHLKPGGHVVITVPSPQADLVLDTLRFLRIIDGMALEQHYGFKPHETTGLFEGAGLRLVKKRRFQLGFNNLFVFQKSESPSKV